MSLRNLNIAPRAFLGFAFIALLVIVLGVFAVNRMTTIRQASIDMETTQLPSVGFLGNLTENVLRLRILSFRVLVNRDPAALQEAQTRIGVLVDKVRSAQASYAALPASPGRSRAVQDVHGNAGQLHASPEPDAGAVAAEQAR